MIDKLASFSIDTENPFEGAVDGVFNYLELFEKVGIKSTFFIVGEIAKERPDIVDILYNEGHEVACHGWQHPNIGRLNEEPRKFADELCNEVFEAELQSCIRVLKRQNNAPQGFRAPWFRLNQNNLDIIAKYFRYDSSFTRSETNKYILPSSLREIPVSTLIHNGPKLGTSFLFGPGVIKIFVSTLKYLEPEPPLIMFGHSFDLGSVNQPLNTALWKKCWYYNRCGPKRVNDLIFLFNRLIDNGWNFCRCDELYQ